MKALITGTLLIAFWGYALWLAARLDRQSPQLARARSYRPQHLARRAVRK